MSVLYVPILQTKRGEYSALAELSANIRANIKPMFVLTNDRKESRSTALSTSISTKLGNYPVFIDLTKVDPFNIQNQYYTDFIFNDLLSKNVDFTPVVSVQDPDQSIINFVITHKLNSCLKIETSTFHQHTLHNTQLLISQLASAGKFIDIIIDFGPHIKRTRQAHQQDINHYFFQIYNNFASVIQNIIIAGSSIPNDFPRADYNPYGFEPRTEWLGFFDFVSAHVQQIKHPIFSDYSVTHPDEPEPVDFVNPNAKIRYTISDNYMFAIGYQVLTHTDGYEQYHDMSKIVINSPYYVGSHFSWGDKYLEDCANRVVGCGNMETWVKVGHNHHITFAVHQIANQYGISI